MPQLGIDPTRKCVESCLPPLIKRPDELSMDLGIRKTWLRIPEWPLCKMEITFICRVLVG